MRPTARIWMFCAAAMFALPAGAHDSQAEPPSEEIVVTGTREREEQVRDFVTALTPAPQGSIPRFIDEVCPMAVGLLPAQNEAVAARLRAVAAGARMEVAAAGCVPNAFIIVTADKRAFIEALAARQPEAFAMMTARQIRRLARSPGPAAAWQLEGPVDADGIPLRWNDLLGAYSNDTTNSASRIRIAGGRGFDASVVVVERAALEGLTATQLADYAAMRLFAKLDPARLPASPPPTILTILEAPMGSAVPITMTEWDLGLLRGLYTSPADLNVSGQRSEIRRRVSEELSPVGPEQD